MARIGIVILNYLNYWDTIQCIESIRTMQYVIAGIVVVDNHSKNESFQILYNHYKDNENIILVKTGKNYGFAKGNNVGIKIVRERFQSEFVFVVNNDTIFNQKNFFDVLISYYHKGVAIIGPQITLKNEIIQSRYSLFTSLKDNVNIFLGDCFAYKNKECWIRIMKQLNYGDKQVALHGCALLFTPDFFEYYSGFYDKTFLYKEEDILYFMCQYHDLKLVYAWDAFIHHKEDQSSEQSFQNRDHIKRYFYIKSHKYLIWWIIKNKCKKGIGGHNFGE